MGSPMGLERRQSSSSRERERERCRPGGHRGAFRRWRAAPGAAESGHAEEAYAAVEESVRYGGRRPSRRGEDGGGAGRERSGIGTRPSAVGFRTTESSPKKHRRPLRSDVYARSWLGPSRCLSRSGPKRCPWPNPAQRPSREALRSQHPISRGSSAAAGCSPNLRPLPPAARRIWPLVYIFLAPEQASRMV